MTHYKIQCTPYINGINISSCEKLRGCIDRVIVRCYFCKIRETVVRARIREIMAAIICRNIDCRPLHQMLPLATVVTLIYILYHSHFILK